jgi:hypothetical protein
MSRAHARTREAGTHPLVIVITMGPGRGDRFLL